MRGGAGLVALAVVVAYAVRDAFGEATAQTTATSAMKQPVALEHTTLSFAFCSS